MLSKEICEQLIEKCNLNHAQITLDGFEKNYCKAKGAKSMDYTNVIKNIIDCSSLIDILVCFNATKDNFNDFNDLSRFLLQENGLKNKIKIRLVRVKNYVNGNFDKKCFKTCEFSILKSEFTKKLRLIDQNHINNEEEFERVRPCGFMRFNSGAIDPQGNLYKCEHLLGRPSERQGDVVNGWYYNDSYMNNSAGIKDERCEKCPFYPRCGFALCQGLHALSGDSDKCNFYDLQMLRVKNHVKSFLKEGNND